jgi:hypothetical protein
VNRMQVLPAMPVRITRCTLFDELSGGSVSVVVTEMTFDHLD